MKQRASGARLTFAELAAWAESYWGLTLTRNSSENHGRWSGCWKSGYELSGPFPGYKYTFRRYDTLKQVAKVLEYKQPGSCIPVAVSEVEKGASDGE